MIKQALNFNSFLPNQVTKNPQSTFQKNTASLLKCIAYGCGQLRT